tara:strand:+ start:473 stop:1219 length:747 start_codon:yes stop_codon:yes gene_type:complete
MAEEAVEQATEEAQPESLLDTSDQTVLAEGEYFLSEGVKGNGEVPDWYQNSRYTSVSEQARAYNELEKKFGGFTGAPKDGYQMPEGVPEDDLLFNNLKTFASEANMNQEYFNSAWELLTANEKAFQEVSKEQEMAALGPEAGKRVESLTRFARANMTPEQYDGFSNLVSSANSVAVAEFMIKTLAPKKLPIDGGVNESGITKQEVLDAMQKKHESGQLLRAVDPEYDRKVMQMWEQVVGDGPYQRVVQ